MKKIILVCCLFIGLTTAVIAQSINHDALEKAKGLKKELKLTDKQTDKVAVIYNESAEKFKKIKEDEHGNTNKMMADVGPLRVATIKKIRAVLNPEQKLKYDKLLKGTDSKSVYGGWGDGWSANGAK